MFHYKGRRDDHPAIIVNVMYHVIFSLRHLILALIPVHAKI